MRVEHPPDENVRRLGRDAEAEAEAVSWVRRFRTRGWVSYLKNNYVFGESGSTEAEAALKS